MENQTSSKKWYQKKWFIIPLSIFAVLVVVGLSNQSPVSEKASVNSNGQNLPQVKSDTVVLPPKTTPLNVIQQQNTQTQTPNAHQQNVQPSPQPSPPTYYINSSGNKVQSPIKTQDGSVPAGATARCMDGSYSFSQHRSGTCSHHGGVAVWLD